MWYAENHFPYNMAGLVAPAPLSLTGTAGAVCGPQRQSASARVRAGQKRIFDVISALLCVKIGGKSRFDGLR